MDMACDSERIITETPTVNGNYGAETLVWKSSFDKLPLRVRHWAVRDAPPRAVVLIVHGSGEHCGRYAHVGKFFNDHRIACVGFDHRGHGESGGEQGFVPSVDALYADIESVIARVRTELHPGIPLIIYAHGTGSLICLGHILQRACTPFDCEGMIISTPSLCLRRRPTQLLLFITRAFANLNPHFRLPIEGNYTNVYCNDPEVVEAYRRDVLVHDRWLGATICIYLELGLLLEASIVNTSCPLLIQHGAKDNTTPISGVRQWVQKRVRGNAEFKEWPNNDHELHNDLEKIEVLTFALHWIEQKLEL